MNTAKGTEAQLFTSPQGASPLAGEGENRPTVHDYIVFTYQFFQPQTEAREHEKI